MCRRKALRLAPAATAPCELPARLPLLAAPVVGCWGRTELLSSSKKEDGEETGRPRRTVCLSFQHLPVSPRFTVKVTLPLSRRALCWCGFAAHQMELVPVCTCSRSATSLGTGTGRLCRGWRRAQDLIQQDGDHHQQGDLHGALSHHQTPEQEDAASAQPHVLPSCFKSCSSGAKRPVGSARPPSCLSRCDDEVTREDKQKLHLIPGSRALLSSCSGPVHLGLKTLTAPFKFFRGLAFSTALTIC